MEQDKFKVYAYLLTHKNSSKRSDALIAEHVAYVRKLDAEGKLVICGPFLNYKGGMVVVRAGSIEEAQKIAEVDPFVKSGFESYDLRVWMIGCKENNFLA
ncbi:MAG: YciI family protein [Elusimicrobiales bacterium]